MQWYNYQHKPSISIARKCCKRWESVAAHLKGHQKWTSTRELPEHETFQGRAEKQRGWIQMFLGGNNYLAEALWGSLGWGRLSCCGRASPAEGSTWPQWGGFQQPACRGIRWSQPQRSSAEINNNKHDTDLIVTHRWIYPPVYLVIFLSSISLTK